MASEVPAFREALEAITGRLCPFALPDAECNDDSCRAVGTDYTKLHDWCSLHARPSWATGLSMIEAAELIVAQAIENGNLVRRGGADGK